MAGRRIRRGARAINRAVRPQKWGGFYRLNFLQGTTVQSTLLWDPAVELIEAMNDMRTETVRGWVSLRGNASSTASDVFSAYIMAFDTDETQTVPTGAEADPAVNDAQLNEKQLLWVIHSQVPTNADQPLLIPMNIRTRRKMDPARALMLVTSYSDDANQLRITGSLRTLVSWS